MRVVDILGSEAKQNFSFVTPNFTVEIVVRFHGVTQIWVMDITANGKSIQGVKLSVGVLHMESLNAPFDFVVADNSGNGIDPFQLSDFSSGRCTLFFVEPSEIESIRGIEVAL